MCSKGLPLRVYCKMKTIPHFSLKGGHTKLTRQEKALKQMLTPPSPQLPSLVWVLIGCDPRSQATQSSDSALLLRSTSAIFAVSSLLPREKVSGFPRWGASVSLSKAKRTHSRQCSPFLAMITEQVEASSSPDLCALVTAESYCQVGMERLTGGQGTCKGLVEAPWDPRTAAKTTHRCRR